MPRKTTAASEAATQETSAVAVAPEPDRSAQLVAAVTDRKGQFAALLGLDPESPQGQAMIDRFVTVALHAASRPDVLKATTASLVESIRDAAMLGLEPVGLTGDGAIIVYNEKVKVERPGKSGGVVVVEETKPIAHFQPMYRGLLKLARRSEKLAFIDAQVVYAEDSIDVEEGSDPRVTHRPFLGEGRGEPIGAYAVAELTNGKRYVEWMTTADIEVVRRQSRGSDSLMWSRFWGEGARKSVLRRLLKRLPIADQAARALELDQELEEAPVVTVSRAPATAARARLTARFRPALASGQPDDDGGAAVTSDDPGTGTRVAEGDAAVSGLPTGSDGQETNVKPEPVGVSVDVTPDAVLVEAFDGPAAEVCGATSPPELGKPSVCVLADGHAGAHQDQEGSRWPNR